MSCTLIAVEQCDAKARGCLNTAGGQHRLNDIGGKKAAQGKSYMAHIHIMLT